jgi:serine/threonine protein kinase
VTHPTGLQRYQIMEALGAGSQGQTFRGIDRVTGDSVAIKVLQLKNLGGDWKPFDLFERECQVLRDLQHPAIPRYLDQFTSDTTGEFFLVMELVEGEPLSRRFGRVGMTEPELRALLLQALDILEYLHARHPPVVHRDIKPSNLIVRPPSASRGSPLALIDFGGVRMALAPDGGSTMIGTFGYMAPEQLHGEATPATDIYALGATLAALAAGTPAERLPRRGLTIDLGAVLPPSPLRDVLAQMLAPEPAQRLQDAAAVRRALARALGGAATNLNDRPGSRGHVPEDRSSPASGDLAERPPAALAPSGLPKILNFVIWLWSLLAAGMFWVIEIAVLPLFFSLVGSGRRYRKERRRRRLRERQTAAILAVRGLRKRIEVISERHNPGRPELPPSSDDR